MLNFLFIRSREFENIFEVGASHSTFSELMRYELKYLIPQTVADQIRAFIRPYCSPDKFNTQNGGYSIYSLYLDSPEKRFVSATKLSEFSRLKLRIRYYEENPSTFVHYEIKRKHGEMIHKSRISVPANHWKMPLESLEECRAWVSPHRWEAMREFHSLYKNFGCEPHLIVRYTREAYFSELDKYCRITFDENISYQVAKSWSLEHDSSAWRYLDLAGRGGLPYSPTVLELKCERLVPNWLLEIIRRFDLERCGYSKYVNSFDDFQENELSLIPDLSSKEGPSYFGA